MDEVNRLIDEFQEECNVKFTGRGRYFLQRQFARFAISASMDSHILQEAWRWYENEFEGTPEKETD